MPVLGFNAKAGRLFLHDRMQQADGEWTTVKTDVTMQQPAFAVDFGRLETGWIHFSNVGPQFVLAFYGQPVPAQPDSPGNNANGKPLRFKAGFRLPVIGQAIGGVRELAGNAGALINGMNELHTQYEESGEARVGKIPLVKMTNVTEVRAGQSSNYQPVFTIIRWVDRLADLLGPRTVPPPSQQAASPPVRAAAVRIPQATRYAAQEHDAPPAGRWNDEWLSRDEWSPGALAPADGDSWLDDEIPF
jgi:hypothetical protein